MIPIYQSRRSTQHILQCNTLGYQYWNSDLHHPLACNILFNGCFFLPWSSRKPEFGIYIRTIGHLGYWNPVFGSKMSRENRFQKTKEQPALKHCERIEIYQRSSVEHDSVNLFWWPASKSWVWRKHKQRIFLRRIVVRPKPRKCIKFIFILFVLLFI